MATPWTRRSLKRMGIGRLARTLGGLWKYDPSTGLYTLWRASEWEVMGTDPDGTRLVNYFPLLEKMDDATAEFQDYQGEVLTPKDQDWRSADDVRRGLLSMMKNMLAAMRKVGVRLTTIASGHAWDAVRENVPPKKRRHQKMVKDRMPGVYHGATACALQLHVQHVFPFGDKVFWLRRLLEQHGPLLLAASANSLHVEDRCVSKRYLMSRGVWSFREYPWTSLRQYLQTLHSLLQIEEIDGPHDIHPWAKVCRGSLEQRICDSPGSIQEALALSAVMYALVVYYTRMVKDAFIVDQLPLMFDETASDRLLSAFEGAACFGLSDLDHKIWSPYLRRKRVSLREQYEQLEEMIGPVMDELGYGAERRYFFDQMIAKQDNGAERQRRWYEESGGDVRYVLDQDHAHFVRSLDILEASLEQDGGIWPMAA